MKIITAIIALLVTFGAAADTLSRPQTTLAFVGDILMGTTFPETPRGAYLPANDGRDLFNECKEILQRVDVAAGNSETVFINERQGEAKPCRNPQFCYTFRTPTSWAANLREAGFDLMSIANNHVNDFRRTGLQSTQLALRMAGVGYAGLRDCPTAVVVRNGKRIGFAAFGHSRNTANLNDLDLVRRTVSSLDSVCDIVVVSFHGGEEGVKHTHVPFRTEAAFDEPRGNVHEFAHAAVDAGADIVYGHGPHVNRAMELYRDRLIMYSLGNFCTPFRMNIAGICGYAPLVEVTVDTDGSFIGGRIHPFIQRKGAGPRRDTSGAVVKNLQRLSLEDFPGNKLTIADDGRLSK